MPISRHLPWIAASIVCGCAWGVLAAQLSPFQSPDLRLAVLASPLIGLMVGVAMRPFRDAERSDWEGRVILSVLGLYLSVAFVGLAAGIVRGMRLSAGPGPMAVNAVGYVAALWIALTVSGFVLLLLPLSLASHLVIWRLQRRADSALDGTRNSDVRSWS